MTKTIHNPILPGFHPDPSIVRAGEDFFIATSTFDWFPGVMIHHSKDLVHWRPVARPLDRLSQLNMIGNPPSGGIWAPCLSYDEGTFYLVYTNVRTLHGTFKDTHNYLVTASDITGPWSEPIYLNSSGFDPSLFHDDDGKKYVVNMLRDFRKGRNMFAGIVLQEYSPEEKKLVGPVHHIFQGTSLGKTEGPHLYKRNGYYYLMVAEGGTSWDHAVTVARSKTLTGPYEVDPEYPMLTSKDDPSLALQKAGHASLVDTPNGEWYLVHLCGRPLMPDRRCNLGRETAIQKVHWTKDGWIRLADGGNRPQVNVPAPDLPPHPFPEEPVRDDFDEETLSLHFQSLRVPMDESWMSLRRRPGYLRLYGRESMESRHERSVVARRLQHFSCEAETCVEFEPDHFQQMAGLICLYDERVQYYLRIGRDEEAGKVLHVVSLVNGEYEEWLDDQVSVEGWDRVYLRLRIEYKKLRFFYSRDGKQWNKIGPLLDASLSSDEYVAGLGFSGTFIGMCAEDLSGQKKHADFDYFTYKAIP